MGELYTEVPRRALGIYAHPDDPDVSCGGTLAAWAKAGCEVHVVLCTDGDKGTTDPDVEPGQLARQRAAEAADAAAVIGLAGQHLLHHGDGELDDERELRRSLVTMVRHLKPEVVLCPDPTAVFFGQDYFNHRDHRVTGWVALDAVAPAAGLPHYYPNAGPAHRVSTVLLSGTLEPDVWVDISATVDLKGGAVACHRSQFPDGLEWAAATVRTGAQEAGRQVGVPFAEGFRRLRLGG